MSYFSQLAALDPAPSSLQIATIVVSGVAATASIVAACVSAVTGARRDRSSWLRQEQMRAYEEVSFAAHSALAEIAGGEVDKAIQTPDMPGLDEAFDHLAPFTKQLNESIRLVVIVGQSRVQEGASLCLSAFATLTPLAYPRRGAAHVPALELRREAITELTRVVLLQDQCIRADLGLMSRDQLKRFDRHWKTEASLRSPVSRDDQSARRMLLNWKVRTWDFEDADIEQGWLRSDTPWALLNLTHIALLRPLDAMLISRPNSPWRAAIDGDLNPDRVKEIESDMLSVVQHGGRGILGVPERLHAGGTWVEGESPGEKVYWWSGDDTTLTRP